MKFQIKIGQVWSYQYYDPEDVHDSFPIVITNFFGVDKKIVSFKYLDTWEEDEMHLDIFKKYCKLVNG